LQFITSIRTILAALAAFVTFGACASALYLRRTTNMATDPKATNEVNDDSKGTVVSSTNDSKLLNDEEKKEDSIQKTKPKPVLNKKDSKSGSSYYLYKSTDKEEAKKYAPKKLVDDEAKRVESTVKAQSKGSSWNTGATMEQFDYSEWMKKRVEALLLGVSFKNSSLRITEVVKVRAQRPFC